MKLFYLLNAILLLVACCFFSACWIDPENQNGYFESEGYKPVYGSAQSGEIKVLPSRTITEPGKIYVYGEYLLINELNQGIHVYNNSDPHNPLPVAFIQILGNSDMAIKDNVLYADHVGNLVALEIENFSNVESLGSLTLNHWELGLPPPAGHYFECVDPSKGLVTGWEKVQLKNNDCYAIQ